MRYGICLPNGGVCGDPQTLADLAACAEEAGWDGIFLEDYIVWQGHQDVPTYDPWIALAAMAVRTTHIRLGTSITPLPRRRPWRVASEATTLDHLSNGRLILGVGSGDTTIDISFTHFGEVTEAKQRGPAASYDIVLGGRHRAEDWEAERTLITSLAEAGMTWWVEYAPPVIGGLDEFRAVVQRGPLRID